LHLVFFLPYFRWHLEVSWNLISGSKC
jgi:hypothetical protein